MAQLAHNISSELLSCKICFCQYSRPGKLPKSLRCPHTFCAPCLKQMAAKCMQPSGFGSQASGGPTPGERITCPVCRDVTTLSEAGVRGLTNNLTILTLMDMVAGAPIENSPLTRTRLESPMDGRGRCVQCSIRYPESQYLCGHCICDSCLKCLLQQSEDQCPQCGPSPCKDQSHEISARPAAPLDEAGDASCMTSVPRHTQPVPAPRTHHQILTITRTPPMGPEQRLPKLGGGSVPGRYQKVGGPSSTPPRPPTRPPPFNPTFLTQRGSGASAHGQTSTSPHSHQKQSVSPYGAASAISDHCRLGDPDSLSLCSVASDSVVSHYSSVSPISTLRRTQSMRRPPPPPPQRQYGTLTRNTLSPPQTTVSHSAENIKTKQGGREGRQRSSLLEGAGCLQGPSATIGVSPPAPPPRRIFKTQSTLPTRCIKKFGSYSEIMQTSCFRKPSRVALSESLDIIVTDTRNMTVQLFSQTGDYVSMFKVLGVQDACFITVDKVCVASHTGVHVYSSSGYKIIDIQIGPTVSVVPFKFGFIAAMAKSMHIFRQSLTLVKEINKYKSTPPKKWSPIHKKTQVEFHSIRDIAVTPLKTIVVLDGGSSWSVHILNEDSVCTARIDPAMLACGPLRDPEALAADFSGNVYISDTGHNRVLKFNTKGAFLHCTLSFRSHSPCGVAVTDTGHVIVGLTGDRVAEIRVYSQVSATIG